MLLVFLNTGKPFKNNFPQNSSETFLIYNHRNLEIRREVASAVSSRTVRSGKKSFSLLAEGGGEGRGASRDSESEVDSGVCRVTRGVLGDGRR